MKNCAKSSLCKRENVQYRKKKSKLLISDAFCIFCNPFGHCPSLASTSNHAPFNVHITYCLVITSFFSFSDNLNVTKIYCFHDHMLFFVIKTIGSPNWHFITLFLQQPILSLLAERLYSK